MLENQEYEKSQPIRQLSEEEIQAVGGGFLGNIIAAVAALLAAAGCATIPHKGDRD